MGAVPLLMGELMGPHLTQRHLGRGLSPYQVTPGSIQPFDQTDSTRQDRQDNGPMAYGEPFYTRSPKNGQFKTHCVAMQYAIARFTLRWVNLRQIVTTFLQLRCVT